MSDHCPNNILHSFLTVYLPTDVQKNIPERHKARQLITAGIPRDQTPHLLWALTQRYFRSARFHPSEEVKESRGFHTLTNRHCIHMLPNAMVQVQLNQVMTMPAKFRYIVAWTTCCSPKNIVQHTTSVTGRVFAIQKVQITDPWFTNPIMMREHLWEEP